MASFQDPIMKVGSVAEWNTGNDVLVFADAKADFNENFHFFQRYKYNIRSILAGISLLDSHE